MNWFIEIFTEHTFVQATLVLALICATGLALGQIKIKGISLGVTFVFFAGILAGHFGLNINQDMLTMLQNFGVEVDHNVEISFESFTKLIDYMGGVEIELTEAEAAVLKQAAKNAVFNTPEIPEEYRTSSAGVTNSQ